MKKKITFNGLRHYNLTASLLHAIQALVILLLSKDYLLNITGNYLLFNTRNQRLEPATTNLFVLSLPALIILFFMLSSIAHLVIATIYNKRYDENLTKGINEARWIEYSLSASIMMVAIALLVGVYDFCSLLMIFILTAVMNLAGLVMEVHNQTTDKTSWLSFIIGCIAGVVPWIVIATYMWIGAANGSKAPDFVYWIFGSIFIFFNCCAIN